MRAVLKGRKCFWSSIGSVCALYSEHCSVFWRQSVVWKGREMLQSIVWEEYWACRVLFWSSIGMAEFGRNILMVDKSIVWESIGTRGILGHGRLLFEPVFGMTMYCFSQYWNG